MSIVPHDAHSDNTHAAIIEGLAEELGWECISDWAEGEDLGWGDGSGSHCWEKDGRKISVEIKGENLVVSYIIDGARFNKNVINHYTLEFELCDPGLIELMRKRLEWLKGWEL